MTDTAPRTADRSEAEIIAELDQWLNENWDPDITVEEWWNRLGLSGWGAPMWPEEWYGKDLNRAEAVAVQNRIGEFGALPAPGGLGLLLAGPTIIDHGTDEQKRTLVKDIVTGQRAWCQLFSEPGAGSDLAGLQAKAIKDGDEWIVNGQKVWTSGGHIADMGMLIARTDPEQPKHQGITYFAIDMHQDGMDVRPLKEMTGRALFNEVFMSDVRVPDEWVIGGLNNGWRVANTTLMHERSGLGAGGGSAAASLASPGTVAGDLTKRVGDFVRGETAQRRGGSGPGGAGRGGARPLIELAKATGKIDDGPTRQDLMRLHTLHELARMTNLRAKAARAAKKDIPGLPNIMKLSMSEILRVNRDTGMKIVGAAATLHGYDHDSAKKVAGATGNPFLPMLTEAALFSPGPAIYGGTDQIQKNIIGERVLGLPKEPNQDKVLPFKDLPKNG
ncbi:MAG TPA: acyl-CoA dehydrogenase family protein [Acidimicrobiales bacterium]|nr:acyl-CoA dehydrogenase family protein [Acidimicrobiales bacterium]